MTLRTLSRGACAALLATALPVVAQAATPSPVAGAVQAPAAGAVSAFYQSRGDAPIWLRDRSAAAQLVSVLRQSPLDGLAIGPRLAADAEAALARAQSGDRAAVRDAERLLSTAWVLYVQALSTPPAGMTYADNSLAPRSLSAGQILEQASAAASAASLTRHVQAVSSVNPIYAELREAALNQAQLGGAFAPDARVVANLDRARALPSRGRYVVVDAASQQLLMIEDGAIRDRMKVVVGKPGSQTPMLASTIHWATLNPYWNVPADLSKKLIAPRVLEKGLSYLKTQGYEVVSSFGENAQVLDASSVDWQAIAAGTQTVFVRQKPGGANAMGKVKFSFPNTGGIYLHDTPDKALFAEQQRTFSNGCVRLEDAQRLGRWLLGRDLVAASSAPEQHVSLGHGVPVYLTYLTARPEGGQLTYVSDVYGRDASATAGVMAALK